MFPTLLCFYSTARRKYHKKTGWTWRKLRDWGVHRRGINTDTFLERPKRLHLDFEIEFSESRCYFNFTWKLTPVRSSCGAMTRKLALLKIELEWRSTHNKLWSSAALLEHHAKTMPCVVVSGTHHTVRAIERDMRLPPFPEQGSTGHTTVHINIHTFTQAAL